MLPAPLRPDEAGSLQALQALQVLDSAPEPEFDALVRAASLLCGVPIALLSLIDAQRQWFKANLGLPGITETPRDLAFCAHAVLGSDVFEVPDATLDARFVDNPLVADRPDIRFYAGAPIQLSSGHLVGTLCLIDHSPHKLTEAQREALRCLAQVAAHALEGRRAMQQAAQVHREREHTLGALARSEDRLRSLYQATPALLHAIDMDGRLVMVSDAWLARLGYARDEVLGRHSVEFLTPASRAFALEVGLPGLRAKGWHNDLDIQLVSRAGELIDVLLSAIVEKDATGKPVRIVAGLQDVTLRRRAERALGEERQRLHNIIESTDAGTWEWQVQTGAARFNERWAQMIGHTLADLAPLTAQTWIDHLHPDDTPACQRLLADHFAGHSARYEAEFRMGHQAGHWVWMLARGRVMSWTADGQPEWMFGTHQDITARKQQEQALRKSEDFLDRTGRLAGVGGWELDIASSQLTWSAETRRIHRVAADFQPVLAGAIAFYAPEARPVIQAAVELGLKAGTPWDMELPLIPADGHRIWVRAVGAVEFADGKPVRLVGAFQDITQRKQLAHQLTNSERFLRQVMAASPLGMFVAEASGRCQFTNPTWQRIAGMAADASLGFGWHLATHPQDRQRVIAEWQQAIASGKAQSSEHRYQRPDGSVVWVAVHIAPIGHDRQDAAGAGNGQLEHGHGDGNSPGGYHAGVVGTVEDITQKRLLDQALAHKTAELARSNQDLERFAYVASHDLQEPLRMVTSYGQLLVRRHQAGLNAEAQEFLQFMVDGGQRAQALIRDLLSLARIDSQPLPWQAVTLDTVLADALQQLRLQVQEAGATITHAALPTVMADARQMGQLLGNLISNALKFRAAATAPAIHLAATRQAGGWRISVRDNGVGIEPKYFDRIFVMFQRLHLRSEHDGTGIGLAICKRVVERHGGRIGVESEPGCGSTFWFTLPDHNSPLMPPQPEPTPVA